MNSSWPRRVPHALVRGPVCAVSCLFCAVRVRSSMRSLRLQKLENFAVEFFVGFDVGKMSRGKLHELCAANVVGEEAAVGGGSGGIVRASNDQRGQLYAMELLAIVHVA